jgi:DNA-binding GntR family transcriptional regulator
MSPKFAIERVSTVDAVAASLRTRILDGDLPPGERLREIELTEGYGVARLAELTELEPLFELRTALEVEAARLALVRHGGRMPKPVHDAVRLMDAVCAQPDAPWSAVVEAHAAVHRAIVAAAESPRILRAYDALAGELHLYVIRIRPAFPLQRMAAHHDDLLRGLEAEGPEALRRHLAEGAGSLSA